MSCPKCGCKVHYQYDTGWDGDQDAEGLERCAACGEIFDIEDSADEDDDEERAAIAPASVLPGEGGTR